jgi:opacity protein-like surface antigen
MFKGYFNFLCFFTFISLLLSIPFANAQVNPDPAKWYAGIFGGYLSGELNSDDPAHKASTGDYKDDSPMAGVFIGYQYQLDKDWVAGAELVIPLYMEKGTAVDKVYFPDLVTYEASYRYALFLTGKFGYCLDKALPYVFGTVGFANVNGKTYNVDLEENYSPGFEQSAAATHLIWQIGGGIDYNISEVLFASARVGAFIGTKADHTMPWNEPGPNMFGYNALLIQVNFAYRFRF